MRFRMAAAMALLASACGAAGAQDGGKIGWKGKARGEEVATLMAQAKKDGMAMMLFFTSEG
ncbi:MAG TPA: hypothetical protein VJB14_01960 [Planctomycetota bacterium]|nr:hypothetical protein [Planctomycetota bacterium]